MTYHADVLTSKGYVSMLKILRNIFDLLALFAFLVFLTGQLGWLQILMIAFPLAMVLFSTLRHHKAMDLMQQRNKSQRDMVEAIEEIADAVGLITGFACNLGERFITHFDGILKTYNGKRRAAAAVVANDEYFGRWLSLICVAFWIMHFGTAVIHHGESRSNFVVTLDAFTKIGAAWCKVYGEMINIFSTLTELDSTVQQINMPVDLHQREQLYHKKCEISADLKQKIRAQVP